MKTAIKITEFIYKILNVTDLTSIISGKICRLDKPKSSEKQDIVINSLPLPRGYHKMQNTVININCYAKNINGIPNINKLTQIQDKVIDILKNYEQHDNNFYYEVVETQVLEEIQQNSMSFVNIKLNIHTK